MLAFKAGRYRKQSGFIQKQLHLSLMYLLGLGVFFCLSCLIAFLLKVYTSIELLFLALVKPHENWGI